MKSPGYRPLYAALFLIALSACARAPLNTGVMTAAEHSALASVYASKGEDDLALREYEKAAQTGASNADVYFAIGNIHLKKKRFEEAKANYLKAIGLNPGAAAFYNNLGWLYMETGELDKAESAANEALKKDPQRGYIYLDTLGVIETARGRFVEAEKNLNAAAETSPAKEKEGLIVIYGHLLDLYHKTGDKDKAAAVEGRIKGLN